MKFRTGFVSNSSSASFVLHTDFSLDKFKEILKTNLPKYFSEANLRNELDRLLKIEKDALETFTQDGAMWKLWRDQAKGGIERWEKIKRDLDKLDLVDTVFDIYRYSLEDNQLLKASIRGSTSMYNDEKDLGELFLAIRDMLEEKCGHNSWMMEFSEDD